MTIFFVTASDEPTLANHSVALKIIEQDDLTLFAEDATRLRLHSEVRRNPDDRKIFAMSHGSENELKDAVGDAALSGSDAVHLQGYKIFCVACLTGRALGKSFAASGSIWWGYDIAINAPDDRPPYLEVFSELLLVMKQTFSKATDVATVNQVLDTIKDTCVKATDRLHALGASEDIHAMAIYSCCNEIWQHLCVWVPDEHEPVMHAETPPSSIFG